MATRPKIIPRSEHPISRRDIDPDCLQVLTRLYQAGHEAYLVGGGVRDLLLGIQPKDFDVATDASPQRIRRLFRNCVLVGRRFRLAHVRFGRNVIEVSTFRQAPDPNEVIPDDDEELLIRRDNTFGTPSEDAARRDFTINALFYDIGTFSIIDHVGGLADLEDHVVRSIGDPRVRYREDPVRMIRAAKFAARLDFEITEADLAAIDEFRGELALASVPRLLEEIFKLLRAGSSAAAFRILDETGLLRVLLPEVAGHLLRTDAAKDPEAAAFYRWLFSLDDHVQAATASEFPNPVLLAALLAPLLEERLRSRHGAEANCWNVTPEQVQGAFEEVVRPVLRRFTVSRRDSERLHDALVLQPHLVASGGAQTSCARRPAFAEAVAVLGLAAPGHPELEHAFERWHERAVEASHAPQEAPRRRRVRSNRRERH